MASNAPEYNTQTIYGPSSSSQQKVAIPRLQRVETGQSGIQDRRRVPRACTGVSLNHAQPFPIVGSMIMNLWTIPGAIVA
jgi:hypothetical protein